MADFGIALSEVINDWLLPHVKEPLSVLVFNRFRQIFRRVARNFVAHPFE